MSYSSIEEIFDAFCNLKVAILGDVMVDAYDWGKVERISPEAPVPIIQLESRENRLGGAANVALNVQALGAVPYLLTVVGLDGDGMLLENLLDGHGLPQEGILKSPDRITTSKRRVIAAGQQLLRIDNEVTHALNTVEQSNLKQKIKEIVPLCDVLIFEDYDKGVINEEIITFTVSLCKEHGIPCVVDPKKRNFLHYKDVTLFKPNLKELKEGLKIEINSKKIEEIKEAVNKLHKELGAESYLITLSEQGVYVKNKEIESKIPAHVREISDVSGAGDSVISTAALCVALKLPLEFMAELSNLAGGMVCEHVGVVPVNKPDLLAETIKLDLWARYER